MFKFRKNLPTPVFRQNRGKDIQYIYHPFTSKKYAAKKTLVPNEIDLSKDVRHQAVKKLVKMDKLFPMVGSSLGPGFLTVPSSVSSLMNRVRILQKRLMDVSDFSFLASTTVNQSGTSPTKTPRFLSRSNSHQAFVKFTGAVKSYYNEQKILGAL